MCVCVCVCTCQHVVLYLIHYFNQPYVRLPVWCLDRYISILVVTTVSLSIMCCGEQVYGQFTYNPNTEECDFDDDTPQGKAPRKVFLALGFLLPCIIIITSYSYIYYKVCSSCNEHNALYLL